MLSHIGSQNEYWTDREKGAFTKAESQNTRSRKDKKSGRKRPRPGDMEIIAATDSSTARIIVDTTDIKLPLCKEESGNDIHDEQQSVQSPQTATMTDGHDSDSDVQHELQSVQSPQTARMTDGHDSDSDVQCEQQSVQSPQTATMTDGHDSDSDVQREQQSGQSPPTAIAKESIVIDVDAYICKQPPEPYWIPELELYENDRAQLMSGAWLTDKHVNASNKLLQ